MIPIKLKVLKKAYQDAVNNGSDQFFIGSIGLVTSYAKYLIEYLESNEILDEDIIVLTTNSLETIEKN